MTILEIVLIGVALSADALSVTVCNELANPHLPRTKRIAMPVLFGVFQGVMPLAGFYASSFAATFIERYAGIISFVILAIIGGKMVWDALHETPDSREMSYKVLLLQAIATSIDAFAVGVTFCAEGANIWLSAPIIAVCTFLLCLAVLPVAGKLGERFGQKAQIAGGVILILIGIKALLS